MAEQVLNALFGAQTSQECLDQATNLANLLKKDGLSLLSDPICPALEKASKDKKNGIARESAIIAFSEIFVQFPPSIPHLLPYLPIILDAASDKGQVVREAAELAIQNLLRASEPYALSTHVLPAVLVYLQDGSVKWQSRIAALTILEGIAAEAPERMGERLENVVPVVASCIHDTKSQVSEKATSSMKKITDIVQNQDLEKSMPHILLALSDPSGIKECIRALSHTTFVAEVGPPTLALLTPLLKRSMMDAAFGVNTQRQTAVVVDNLVRLVPDPTTCADFLKELVPGVKRVAETASMPEVRALATRALATLHAAGAEEPATAETASVKDVQTYVSKYTTTKGKEDDALLLFVSQMITDMIKAKDYYKKTWEKTIATFLAPIATASPLDAAKQIFSFFWEEYKRVSGLDTPVTGEIPIVDTDFSLAYGGMMLLNKTTLKLFRGKRYGVCARNGAGKSTLLRAISEGKVEGFPSADELTPFFVEHKLQGEEGDMSVYSFVKKDFEHKTEEQVRKVLEEVGFETVRQEQNVGALSGGWKMKLELARAMMSNVDILLLDEPTNHLDTTNVAWLQDYLNSQDKITSIIVSHDSGFLDAVCTDIIHYESKKLAYYPGNLSDFVKQKPEAKSYYTLSATNVAFSFPPPGILTGINSRTKAILRLRDCTFTYPGVENPSLYNVSAALSLSSRIGIIGKNGAGKSTFIKVLTGEVIPQEGKVEKHPNLRVGYVAQHSLHHVNQHVHLTPNQYIQWRYQFGEDKEVLEKETRKISETDTDTDIPIKNPKTGEMENRRIEYIVGRQKLKKSFQYEIKWKMMEMRHNMWVPREKLIELGMNKLVQRFDDWEAGREGLGSRDLNPAEIRKHLETVGLDGDIADNNEIGGLSGGQKVKVVIAGAMWAKPHLLVLDEPTNYLDRDSLGGLAVAIRDWSGGVVMISHNDEFVSALCPEKWTIADGKITTQGKSAVDAAKFDDNGDIGGEKAKAKIGKKKKMNRNQLKEREARRRLRHINWLSTPPGTPKPEDSDTE
ncbi:mRNA export factor elf1 [Taphrina deformans PYCC 5710]|uniref:Elongation factor 3 n=1 Tax=Taphrina deformans (strain PYCC 5710 / ATCC 11124 / CBS 356.35 / IMI 108563 / JCM 9778 / NBRC 8474) TaxID=1097556 RepID=R4X8Q4_TAPDE|nr:mRNA export factor elf1 [Taphrina deformans PYCC 5710]|eukprot:CCG82024.1 mRNA export factor elf1 [Taphrina deformans PYCC 5710]